MSDTCACQTIKYYSISCVCALVCACNDASNFIHNGFMVVMVLFIL